MQFRRKPHSRREENFGALVAMRFALLEATVRVGLAAAQYIPESALGGLTRALRRFINPDLIPEWLGCMAAAASARMPETRRIDAVGVYYTACTLGIASDIVPYLTPDNLAKHRAMRIVDSMVWAAEHLLSKLAVTHQIDTAVIH